MKEKKIPSLLKIIIYKKIKKIKENGKFFEGTYMLS